MFNNPYIPQAYNPINNYQNQMAQMQSQMSQPAISNNPINWVQGEVGAKSYQVAPNGTAVMFDSEQDRLYIKTADNIGMCNLRTFQLQEITGQATQTSVAMPIGEFVSRSEFDELRNEIEMYKTMLMPAQPTKTTKKGVDDNGK